MMVVETYFDMETLPTPLGDLCSEVRYVLLYRLPNGTVCPSRHRSHRALVTVAYQNVTVV